MAYLRNRGRSCSRTIAIGVDPLKALTTGLNNVGIGVHALGASTTGCLNIAIGDTALGGADTTGIDNIAIAKLILLFN